MNLGTFMYNLRQGVSNIWRNKMFSIASVATMTACIFLLGVFYSIGINFRHIVTEAESSVAITVFFDEDASSERIKEIGTIISERPEVSHFEFVSADEAWESYKKIYFKGREELAESFENDNPLAGSSNYEIYLNDISEQTKLVKYLERIEGVREVHQSEVAAATLTDFNSLIGIIFAGVVFILIFVSVFLIGNTIAVGITVRNEEIAIMKYIGATDRFVRAPFIVEGVIIGLLGSIVPLTLLGGLYNVILSYFVSRFDVLTGLISFIPASQVFSLLIPISLILGVGIGFVGSRITVKRHLHV